MPIPIVAFPLAVPDKRIGLTLILALVDRGANLASLHPPPAAVGSVAYCNLHGLWKA